MGAPTKWLAQVWQGPLTEPPDLPRESLALILLLDGRDFPLEEPKSPLGLELTPSLKVALHQSREPALLATSMPG